MPKIIKPKNTVILLERALGYLRGVTQTGPKSRALMALRNATKFEDSTYFAAGKAIADQTGLDTAEEYLLAAIESEKKG